MKYRPRLEPLEARIVLDGVSGAAGVVLDGGTGFDHLRYSSYNSPPVATTLSFASIL
jgi:hypothetical protein